VSVFQQEILRTVSVTLADPIPDRYSIERVPDPTPEQQALYQQWLGTV
jgi:predicted metalloprotease with PDZ domain